MPLSRKERTALLKTLHDLWLSVDVPPIPPAELANLSDGAVTDLVHFWNFKKQTRDLPNPPAYHSARDVRPAVGVPTAATGVGREPRKTANPGGKLTLRQQLGLRKVSTSN